MSIQYDRIEDVLRTLVHFSPHVFPVFGAPLFVVEVRSRCRAAAFQVAALNKSASVMVPLVSIKKLRKLISSCTVQTQFFDPVDDVNSAAAVVPSSELVGLLRVRIVEDGGGLRPGPGLGVGLEKII
jgi:hypothetical protein